MAKSDNMMVSKALTDYIGAVWSDAKAALAEMPRVSRWFHFFWLMGPFFLLIERSPADAWLAICATAFLIKTLYRFELSCFSKFWFISTALFWSVCLLSSSVSDMPSYSLTETIIWLRFPLFALACQCWFTKDIQIFRLMLFLMATSICLMFFILTAEIIIKGQTYGRLIWPYGDMVTGNFLVKFGLPILLALGALVASIRPAFSMMAIAGCGIFLFFVLMTGERMNTLIAIGAVSLAVFASRPNFKSILIMVIASALVLALTFYFEPGTFNRFITVFVDQLPIHSSSPYFRVFSGGLEAFKLQPFLGIGTANYRHLCEPLLSHAVSVDCNTHPHNFWIQIIAEVGLVGLSAASLMFWAIFRCCFEYRSTKDQNPVVLTAFLVPLMFFMPFQSTADFFGQWNNIFMWCSLGIALSAGNLISR